MLKLSLMADWRERLLEYVGKDGRSDRAISLAAGLGPNFVNELRNASKEARVEKVLRVAAEVRAPLPYVFSGLSLSADEVETLQAFSALSPEAKESVLRIARQLAGAA